MRKGKYQFAIPDNQMRNREHEPSRYEQPGAAAIRIGLRTNNQPTARNTTKNRENQIKRRRGTADSKNQGFKKKMTKQTERISRDTSGVSLNQAKMSKDVTG
jgi:hypothetical protein